MNQRNENDATVSHENIDLFGEMLLQGWEPPHKRRRWRTSPTRGEKSILNQLQHERELAKEEREGHEETRKKLERAEQHASALERQKLKLTGKITTQALEIEQLKAGADVQQARQAYGVVLDSHDFITAGIAVLADATRRGCLRAGLPWPPLARGSGRVWKRVVRILRDFERSGGGTPPTRPSGGGTSGTSGGGGRPVVVPRRKRGDPSP